MTNFIKVLGQVSEKVIKLSINFFVTYLFLLNFDEFTFGMYSTFVAVNSILIVIGTMAIKDKYLIFLLNGRISNDLNLKLKLFLLIISIILILIIQVLLFFYSKNITEYLCATFLSMQLISNIFILGRYNAEAEQSFNKITTIDISLSLITFPLKYYFITNSDLNLFLIIIASELILSNLLLSLSFKELKLNHSENKASFSHLISTSIPIFLSSLFIIIYYRIDTLMISFLVGYSETAIYSAGIKITESLYFLPITISAIFFPNLIKENRLLGIEGDTFRRLVFYLFWSSLICSAFISFFIEPIWRFLFEDKYQHSILITIIHSWTLPFVSLGLISSRIYVIEGLQHLLIYRSLFIVLLNIILNIPAIIFYGALGAVVTTLTSQVFAGLFFDFFNKETRGIFYMKINSLGYLVR